MISMRAWFVVVVIACAAGCPPVTPVPDPCPDLQALCPSLNCVEPKLNSDGCATCECAVQACLINEDCGAHEPPQRCSVAPTICEPPLACTDDDDSTVCGAACFGRCVDITGDSGFCVTESDCGTGSCRFDGRFCLIDDARPDVCSGWCVDGCAEVETIARDPRTGQCFDFNDSCLPPGFIEGC